MAYPKGETRLVQTFEVKVFFVDPTDAVDPLDMEQCLTDDDWPHPLEADEVQVTDMTPLEMYRHHKIAY